MSNSNMFPNNLAQTSINDAYQFNTFSDFIQTQSTSTRFSPHCIFCSSNHTIALINDGSFRQCKMCNKQFKASLITPLRIESAQSNGAFSLKKM